ncbi:hypothetical protein FCV59_20535 [Vibrio sp. F13]|uniref:oligosaccharide flippase family protein n=1 Tax=Vibrio sp. F13 TaxID=2070777 RepID=UPI0010BCFB80|nr:oligosaccharide flippase family protein [Vibrio sp. F13]TKF69491.1 hypothetical protein FCV59_20535 [Vibrio sp. F13]
MKLSKNLTSLVSLQWFQYISAFVVMPHLISSLGHSNYGELIISQAWAALLYVIVEYGFSIIGVSEVARLKNNKNETSKIFFNVTLARVIIFLFIYLLVALVFLSDNYNFDIFVIVAISAFGVAINAQWFFLGKQESHHIIKWTLIIKIICLFLNFVFVKVENDIYIAAIIYSAGYILPAIYTIYVVVRDKKIAKIHLDYKEVFSFFLKATPFLLGRFSNIGVNQLTIIASGYILSASNVTLLSVVMKVIQVGVMVYAPVQQHLLAKMSNSYSIDLALRYVKICMLISAFQLLIIYYASPYLSIFLLGEKVKLFSDILVLCSVIIPISVLHMFIGAPILIPINESVRFNKSVVIYFITHLLIIALLCSFSKDVGVLAYSLVCLPLSKLIGFLIRLLYLYPVIGMFRSNVK